MALSGCGGSASPASSGYPDPEVVTNVPMGPGVDGGTSLRKFVAGDSYTYKVTGTITQEYYDAALVKRTVTAPVKGTCVKSITAATYNGTACLLLTDNLQYTPNGGVTVVSVFERYVTQAADGSVTIIGQRDHSTNFDANPSTAFLPGVFGTGSGISTSPRFTNNSADPLADKAIDYSFSPMSQESVPATVGSFMTWKSNWTHTDTSNYYPAPRVALGMILPFGYVAQMVRSESGTEWWAPNLGCAIKTVLSVTQTDSILKSWTYSSGTFSFVGDILRTSGTLTMTLQSRTLN